MCESPSREGMNRNPFNSSWLKALNEHAVASWTENPLVIYDFDNKQNNNNA